jgi:DNA-binding CsgD family transcriptional regulator
VFDLGKKAEWLIEMNRSLVKLISMALIGIGAVLLGLNIFIQGEFNFGLPLVFLMLAGIFFILVFAMRKKWAWSSVLYIPGALLAALGVIVLINVLTGDWSAWAYAWLLLTAGLGIGLALANRETVWHRLLEPVGWTLAFGSITLFALFGAIAGGLFIQVMAPILLILGGLSLRWLPLERILPEHILARLHLRPQLIASGKAISSSVDLIESLSVRELEVLQLVDQGLSNQEIAARLNIAASTVKTHINNIYGKLAVQTRTQAIRRARELKLFEP